MCVCDNTVCVCIYLVHACMCAYIQLRMALIGFRLCGSAYIKRDPAEKVNQLCNLINRRNVSEAKGKDVKKQYE